MGFIKKQLLKVIKWDDDSSNIIAYRFPMDDRKEIMNGCQLVVGESQVAIMVKEGQIADIFNPGTHRLETRNLPILTTIASWKYDFDSPFKADVYYVNTKQFIDQRWGTSNPVMMRDADFGMIRARAFGKYAFKVSNPATLLREIFGTNSIYTVDALKEHFKTIFVSSFSDALASSKVSALDIATKYDELSEELKNKLEEPFAKMGLALMQVYVENVSLPEEVEKAIDKRTSLGVLDDKMGSYVTVETVGAMRDAASNPNGGGLAGAGVGLGAGFTMAKAMADNMNNAQNTPNQTEKVNTKTCVNCQKPIAANARFCPECGTSQPQEKYCANCGNKISANAKFCPECGNKVE